jgi:ATP-binding cassette subfamily G (WHITE) protein 2 (PDR)
MKMASASDNKKRNQQPFPTKTTGSVFRNFRVYGVSKQYSHQAGFSSIITSACTNTARQLHQAGDQTTILDRFDRMVEEGQSLLVLSRQGSGCSTIPKVIGGSTRGLEIDCGSGWVVNYQGA